jgi:hypothetical protein
MRHDLMALSSSLKHSAHGALVGEASHQSIEATEHEAIATAHAYRAEATEATLATMEVPQTISAEFLHHAASS